jgi:CHRD domain
VIGLILLEIAMNLRFLRPVFLASLLLVSPPAQAATVFGSTLSGTNEAPPNASPAIGTGLITLSDAQDVLGISAVFLGLTGGTTNGGLYCCAPAGANGGLAVNFTGFVTGISFGGYANSFNLLSPTTYSASFLAAHGGTAVGAKSALVSGLLSGLSYINIATTAYQGGEIRGQNAQYTVISPVPEPSQWAMLLGGLFATASIARVRRNGRGRIRQVFA